MNKSRYQQDLDQALLTLEKGGVIVVPTDTLFGLAADVFSEPGVRRIFEIKGRPPGLALPVLVADWDQLEMVVHPLPVCGLSLARRFWPGPLTLVMPKSPRVPGAVTAGGPTVAVRMPDHCVPLELARRLGSPITGTSANRSGQEDPATLEDVERQLGGLVDYIVRGGPVPGGKASTIVDVSSGASKLIREGAIPFDDVLRAGR